MLPNDAKEPRAGEAAEDGEPGGLPVGWEGLGHKAAPLLSVPSPWLLATMPAAFRPYFFSESICKVRGHEEARAEACR